MKRRLLIILATLGMALGAVLPITAAAAPGLPAGLSAEARAQIAAGEATYIDEATLAAAGCGSFCDDKDPATYRIYYDECSNCYYKCATDALTVRWGPSGSPGLELRYSPRCRTAWTKVSREVWVSVESLYSNGNLRRRTTGFAGQYYTNMLNDDGYYAVAYATYGPTTYKTSPPY
jgi:hypothetical protein